MSGGEGGGGKLPSVDHGRRTDRGRDKKACTAEEEFKWKRKMILGLEDFTKYRVNMHRCTI